MSHRGWTLSLVVMGLGLGLGLGCGPTIVFGDTEGQSTEEGTAGPGPGPGSNAVTTAVPPPPSQTTTPVPPPPDSGTTEEPIDETGNPFLIDPDDGGTIFECSLWLQDCPQGQKCTAWANDGGNSWNAWRCVPIAEDPGAPGDPCIIEGSAVSGLDDCELGSMCFYVDARTDEGTCIAFCTGSEDNPTCEVPGTTCFLPGNGVLPLCIPDCDPLLQDCGPGQACYGLNDSFSCVVDASGDMGAAGDPCEYLNACDPGTECVMPEEVPGCMGALGCCSAYCSLADPMPPCLPGQSCVPYFEPGMAPPGYELLGHCGVP